MDTELKKEEVFYVKLVHVDDEKKSLIEEDANHILSFISQQSRGQLNGESKNSEAHLVKIKKIYFIKGDVLVVCRDEFTKSYVEGLDFSEKNLWE